MIEKSPTIIQLIRNLQQIPYFSSKNIYRIVGYFLDMNPQKIDELCKSLQQAKQNIIRCAACFSWKEKDEPCIYCSDKRDQSVICVVETWHELIAIEKTGGYKGLYHVLGGALSPLEGIEPMHLHIQELRSRVSTTPLLKEIILAMNQTPEGEATAAYVAHTLRDCNLTKSRLAQGVPVGSSLEYIDKVTMYKALTERKSF